MNRQNKTCKITGSLIGNQPDIDKLISAGNDNLTIDFSECTFISVPGLEWLKETLSRASANGVNISYTAIPPVLYKVFKVARIDSILNACGSPASPSSEQIC